MSSIHDKPLGSTYTHNFYVEEFKRPDFVVKCSVLKEKDVYLMRDPILFKTHAAYYAGGALPDCKVTWSFKTEKASFSPPGYMGYTFDVCNEEQFESFIKSTKTIDGATDDEGNDMVKVSISGNPGIGPFRLIADVEVLDINEQSLFCNTNLLVHTTEYYVGIKPAEKHFTVGKKEFTVKLVVCDINGNSVPGITVFFSAGSHKMEVTSKEEPIDITFPIGGKYDHFIEARISPLNCMSDSRSSVKISPKDLPSSMNEPKVTPLSKLVDTIKEVDLKDYIQEDSILIKSDQKSFNVGEDISFYITSEVYPCDGLLTLRKNGIIAHTTFVQSEQITEVVVPILPEYVGGLRIQADLNGFTKREGDTTDSAPPIPYFSTSSLDIKVNPNNFELDVSVVPEETRLEPGGSTDVKIQIKDWMGHPVSNCEVALIVVDESVLSLSGYEMREPIESFFSRVISEIERNRENIRSYIKKIDSDIAVEMTKDLKKIESNIDKELINASDKPEPLDEQKFEAQTKRLLTMLRDLENLRKTTLENIADSMESSDDVPVIKNLEIPPAPEPTIWRGLVPKLSNNEVSEIGIVLPSPSVAPPPPPPSLSSGGAFNAMALPPSPLDIHVETEIMEMDISTKSEGMTFNSVLLSKNKARKKSSRIPQKEKKQSMDRDFKRPQKKKAKKSMVSRKMGESFSMKSSIAPSLEMKCEVFDDDFDDDFDESSSASEDELFMDEEMLGEYSSVSESYSSEESSEMPEEVKMRTNFNPLAEFSPSVITDEDGFANIEITLPDNLTRYRVWAIAIGKDLPYSGVGESLITAQLPLVVRVSPPRFLTYGDRFELPVIVQNLFDIPLQVKVAIRTVNAFIGNEEEMHETGYKFEVPAEGRRLVTVPATTKQPGDAIFQISCVSRKYGDAQQISIPVYQPPTTQSFASYGSIGGKESNSLINRISLPEDSLNFGNLSVSCSSTQMQNLRDGVLYLLTYPYDCNEQLASKFLGYVYGSSVVSQFPETYAADAHKVILKGMKTLKQRQSKDGSFGLYPGYNTDIFVSSHVLHSCGLCKEYGYNIAEGILGIIKSWTKDLESFLKNYCKSYQTHEIENNKNTVWEIAYARYARWKYSKSKKIAEEVDKFLSETSIDKLPLSSLAVMGTVLAQSNKTNERIPQIARYLCEHAILQVDDENRTVKVTSEGIFSYNSDYRLHGLLLEFLVNADTENELIPYLVNGLLERRRKGIWDNTQGNLWALVGISSYLNIMEKQKPSFTSRLWIDHEYCGEASFKGRTFDQTEFQIGIPFLKDNEAVKSLHEHDLLLQKDGKGRLYFRLALNYSPSDMTVEPIQRGFQISREYQNFDSKEIIGDTVEKGTVILVTLNFYADFDCQNVIVVDKLPGGWEIDKKKSDMQINKWTNHV
eukprot:TRINITY_DN4605_c0_g1_i1.p1 TRINITY_DN4605_c0_g1~~TRINITY_DN4605_c0_g1_i1.p1  ORF type:complete len:1414 (-),score=325.84 TRINITY_DN4605_c0_g1_i1:355-4551(-)